MGIAVLTICAFLGGAACVFFYYESRKAIFANQQRKFAEQVTQHNERVAKLNQSLSTHQSELQVYREAKQAHAKEVHRAQSQLNEDRQRHTTNVNELFAKIEIFNKQKVSYEELLNENKILKTDLRNMVIALAKQDFENKEWGRRQELVSAKSNILGRRFLKDTLKWIDDSLNQHNYAASKQRLNDAIVWCREIGVEITNREEHQMQADLKSEYEKVVRAAFEREEQARIRAQIKEEQQHEREVQRAIDEAEREKRALEAALARLKAEADGKHTEEIKKLEAQLAEAIAKSQRAISQAQLTKAGNVYIISNIGSLGTGIFKIGMTRRLEPLDRVRELGSASVPFPYDVHMMISTNNAPGLENALHRAFHKHRVNKANPRKEFFKIKIEDIVEIVKKEHGEVLYTADPEALQYRQSLNMKEEDQQYIEEVFEKMEATKSHFADEDD